jgi:hypothetical protein
LGETHAAVAEWLTAIGTVGLALAALFPFPFLLLQIRKLSEQIRLSREVEERAAIRTSEWETLKVCQRYDFDPVIDAACQRIAASSHNGTKYSAVERRDMIAILNYFDGIAIGVQQGLYIEAIVKDQLGPVLDTHVRDWMKPV